jgi:endonuclease/exonuclease/phosphatase family metal-dependent hydrolase
VQSPDLLFLQEVQGKNLLRSLRHEGWPVQAQHHYLAGGWITRWYMA